MIVNPLFITRSVELPTQITQKEANQRLFQLLANNKIQREQLAKQQEKLLNTKPMTKIPLKGLTEIENQRRTKNKDLEIKKRDAEKAELNNSKVMNNQEQLEPEKKYRKLEEPEIVPEEKVHPEQQEQAEQYSKAGCK